MFAVPNPDQPMIEEREAYLSFLLTNGRKSGDVCQVASMLTHVIQHCGLARDESVTMLEIKASAMRWLEGATEKGRRCSPKMFQATARDFFRFIGRYQAATDFPAGFIEPFVAFASEIRNYRGYSATAAASIVGCTRRFLSWLSLQQTDLQSVQLDDVGRFMSEKVRRGAQKATMAGYTGALRIFFDYAEQHGWSASNISRRIESGSPRKRRAEPPTGPPWPQVRRLLASLDDSQPSQCRAKAILLLAAVYGLRKAEISRLTLDDFDWQTGVLTVHRSKRGPTQQFPIQPELHAAVRAYIDQFRPQCQHPELFITLLAPYRPTLHLSNSMAKVMAAQKIFVKRCGLHALRHSCATELLRQGTSLRGIADFLGHKNLRSVSIYARCDNCALRRVADFSLTEVL